MTEKRFNYHIDEVGIYYYVCDNTKKGDDKILFEFCSKLDAMEVCDFLNELHEEKEQLLSDKEHLMGYLIRFCRFDDEDLDYVMNRESNREYGKAYYGMKEDTEKGL